MQVLKRFSTPVLLIAILFIAFLSINSKNKTETSFLRNHGLKGNIKSINSYYLNPNCDLSNIQKGDTIKGVNMYFDSQGRLRRSFRFDGENNPQMSVTYEYDEKDNPTEVVTYTGSGSIKKRLVKYYDKKGLNLAEKEYNPSGGLKTHLKNIYDSNGNLIETFSTLDHYLYPTIKYDYDEDNRLVEIRNCFAFNKCYKSIYKYDDVGNVIKALEYDTDGTIDTGYIATYFKKGLIEMKVQFENDSIFDKIYYEYDSKDRILVETYFNPDGSYDYELYVNYDNYNNRVMEKYYGRYNGSMEYIKTFDEKGNVILEVRKWNNKVDFIEKSTIIYY